MAQRPRCARRLGVETRFSVDSTAKSSGPYVTSCGELKGEATGSLARSAPVGMQASFAPESPGDVLRKACAQIDACHSSVLRQRRGVLGEKGGQRAFSSDRDRGDVCPGAAFRGPRRRGWSAWQMAVAAAGAGRNACRQSHLGAPWRPHASAWSTTEKVVSRGFGKRF